MENHTTKLDYANTQVISNLDKCSQLFSSEYY